MPFILWLALELRFNQSKPEQAYYTRKNDVEPDIPTVIRTRKKPQWVIDEVIYLKAVNPALGGRKIADIFNRRFAASRAALSR